jgi:hypothetical protein
MTNELSAQVPKGAPSWVTPEAIADTLRVWQPYYKQKLTDDDALEIIMNVTRLVDVQRMIEAKAKAKRDPV